MKNRQMQKPTPLLFRKPLCTEVLGTSTDAPGHGGHADSTGRPHQHGEGKEPSRIGLRKDHVSRKLADKIADVERRNASVPDRVGHT